MRTSATFSAILALAPANLAFAPAVLAAPAAAPQADYTSAPASVSAAPVPDPPIVPVTDVTMHGPYTGGPATTTGALSLSVLAPSIAPLPPNPTATTYPSDGQLHDPQPAPYTPAGGLGTNGTEPVYNAKSDFDFESLVSSWCLPLTCQANLDVGSCIVPGMDRA